MRPRTLLITVGILLPVAFVAGWYASRGGMGAPGGDARKVLYYVDPMNPAFHSPDPGTAPCGMPLEPVYADGPTPGAAGAAGAGGVSVRPDRLQLIGIAREQVQPQTLQSTLRVVGTVAADENRLYRISAATAGRVREISPVTTGSQVAMGEVLGAYYATEILVPQQNFLRMHEAYQKVQKTGANPRDNFQGGGQLATYWRNVDVARQTLMNLGMSAEQLDEVAGSRQPAYLVQMRAPAAGFVTARNVVLGQSFEAGEELYAIADLSRVWVLADAFEGQERFFMPGRPATVVAPGSGRRFEAEVSRVLPQFEAATRTLKVRLEVRNPDFALRPDMFVDVELPVEIGPALFLPQEAVLDSGTRKVVFVEQEAGVFVPRPVATGRHVAGQVEIRGGLMAGETVVTSGNFLLDSESRMRAAGAAAVAAALDPVCGMEVDEAKARSQGLVGEHGGKSWFFCSPACKQTFERDPQALAGSMRTATEAPEPPPRAHGAAKKAFLALDPVCGMEVDPDEAGRAGLVSVFDGAPFPFCSPACRIEFERDPRGVLSRPPGAAAMPAPASQPMGPGGAPSGGAMQMPAGKPGAMPGMRPQDAPMGETMPMPSVDPVCGMHVDPDEARAQGLVSEHGGKTWFFCTPECKRDFGSDPDAYLPAGK